MRKPCKWMRVYIIPVYIYIYGCECNVGKTEAEAGRGKSMQRIRRRWPTFCCRRRNSKAGSWISLGEVCDRSNLGRSG